MDVLTQRDILQLQRTTGNHATKQLLGVEQKSPVSNKPQTIQRLMSWQSFKGNTHRFAGRRHGVRPVDNALKAYHTSIDGFNATTLNEANFATLQGHLQTIIAECQTYENLSDKHKRKGGVTGLRLQAHNELAVINNIINTVIPNMPFEEGLGDDASYNIYMALMDVQDYVIRNPTLNVINTWVNGQITNITMYMQRGDQNDPARTLRMRQFLQNEVGKLQQIANDVNTPPTLRNILTEITDKANRIQFTPNPATSHLVNYDDDRNNRTYEVMHGLNPGMNMGSGEVQGSIAHEMTHVTVGDTFAGGGYENPIMLGFALNATDDVIRDLYNNRRNRIEQIKDALNNDVDMNASQKMLLQMQLNYATEDKFKVYLTRPNITRNLSPEQLNRLNHIANNITTNGDSAIMVEYDAVMTELLLAMHKWGIPATNPTFAAISDAAQEAYDQRQTHLGG